MQFLESLHNICQTEKTAVGPGSVIPLKSLDSDSSPACHLLAYDNFTETQFLHV